MMLLHLMSIIDILFILYLFLSRDLTRKRMVYVKTFSSDNYHLLDIHKLFKTDVEIPQHFFYVLLC